MYYKLEFTSLQGASIPTPNVPGTAEFGTGLVLTSADLWPAAALNIPQDIIPPVEGNQPLRAFMGFEVYSSKLIQQGFKKNN